MDTVTFLEMMSVQRHDFLNHLQVISGLVQLNKGDRVKEYIRQISAEMEHLGKLARISAPEVTAVLLLGYFLAYKHQVKVLFDINTNVECCPVSGEILVEALEDAFRLTMECCLAPQERLPGHDRHLKISADGLKDGKYLFKISFPAPSCEGFEAIRAMLAGIGGRMEAHGGKADIAVSAGRAEICMVCPAKHA